MMRVTELLQRAGVRPDLPFMSEEAKAWYMQRGTMIHRATVMVDAGTLDWKELDPRILGYVKAYQKFVTEICPTVIETEHEVVSKKYAYDGHLDRVYKIGGLLVLCDIKTNRVDVATRLQTCAYQIARDGRKIARMGLALHEDGTYKATWWRSEQEWKVDREGWLFGVLPDDKEQIGVWKKKVGF